MTLTWNNSTNWATSALDETTKGDSLKHKGLTSFGIEVVKRMNDLGMLVDLSHVGEQTFWDAIKTTTKPVIVSHSCVYKICPHRRNLKDEQIKAVGKNGGVIHLNFYSGFLDSSYEKRTADFNNQHKAERDSLLKVNPEPYFADKFLFEKYPAEVIAMRPPLSLVIDHIDYLVKMIGAEHVGLGSDFDGVNSLPQQLDDVTAMPLITKALLERGYSKKDIRNILGENFLRILHENAAN
jgi:membrane dipeptidase